MSKSLKITTVTCDPVTIIVYILPVKERRAYSRKEKVLFLSNPSFLPEAKYTPLPVYLFFIHLLIFKVRIDFSVK